MASLLRWLYAFIMMVTTKEEKVVIKSLRETKRCAVERSVGVPYKAVVAKWT